MMADSDKRKIGFDIIFVIIIVALGLFQVFRCEYPGLYLDSVNPDYLAVQILFPQINNPHMSVHQTGFPMLGQLYHGTVTVWLQLLLIGLSGKASVFTLRLANMVYVLGICFSMYVILKKLKANLWLSGMLLMILIMSPQVFSFIRTQYYIKLPGTLFLFISMYFLIDLRAKKMCAWQLVLSGFFCGLAFYSYFIYLFFMPVLLVLCIISSGADKKWKNSLVCFSGFCNGTILYGIGYMDFVISEKLKGGGKNIIGIEGIFVILGWIFLFLIVRNYNDRKNLIIQFKLALAALFLLVVLVFVNKESVIAILVPRLSSLNIAGESMDLVQRVKQVFFLWQGVMNNKFSEWLMLGFSSSIMPDIYTWALFLGTIGVSLIHFIKKQEDILFNAIVFLIIMQVSYAFITIIFISRMGGQHFTPMFYLGFFTLIMEVNFLFFNVKCFQLKIVDIIVILCFFFMNIANANLLNTNLEITGGNYMFTSRINEMASTALENKKNGLKEVYIFPEWGFLCGFNYLTMNQVHFMTSVDVNELGKYIADGYSFKICSWEKEKIDQYIEALKNSGISNLTVQDKATKTGMEGFYIIEQKIKKRGMELHGYER